MVGPSFDRRCGTRFEWWTVFDSRCAAQPVGHEPSAQRRMLSDALDGPVRNSKRPRAGSALTSRNTPMPVQHRSVKRASCRERLRRGEPLRTRPRDEPRCGQQHQFPAKSCPELAPGSTLSCSSATDRQGPGCPAARSSALIALVRTAGTAAHDQQPDAPGQVEQSRTRATGGWTALLRRFTATRPSHTPRARKSTPHGPGRNPRAATNNRPSPVTRSTASSAPLLPR